MERLDNNKDFVVPENPVEDIQKRFEVRRAEHMGGGFGEILSTEENSTIDLKELEQGLEASDAKPKVTKIKAKDRVLPKNLFWQYGKNGRIVAVDEGEISNGSVDAMTLRDLINSSGAQIYLRRYNALSRRVFGDK